eukprot:1516834-Rhodomonas_salina.4
MSSDTAREARDTHTLVWHYRRLHDFILDEASGRDFVQRIQKPLHSPHPVPIYHLTAAPQPSLGVSCRIIFQLAQGTVRGFSEYRIATRECECDGRMATPDLARGSNVGCGRTRTGRCGCFRTVKRPTTTSR